jgi:hypothetical protein
MIDRNELLNLVGSEARFMTKAVGYGKVKVLDVGDRYLFYRDEQGNRHAQVAPIECILWAEITLVEWEEVTKRTLRRDEPTRVGGDHPFKGGDDA